MAKPVDKKNAANTLKERAHWYDDVRLKAAVLGLADVRVFALELLLLMLLLVMGTLIQAKVGLYAAQQMIFESWVWWAAGVVPLPGMKLVLALICVGLVVRLAREPLVLSRVPVWLVHAGVVLLLAGSALANYDHVEGYALLAEGETTHALWNIPEDTPNAPPDTWTKGATLPFALTLTRFSKEFHPGTDMARAYQSDVVVKDGDGTESPAAIAMNQPLRHRGWALFQASYWVDAKGREVSVLAVVQNKGRVLPYLAGLIVALGMLGVVGQRFAKWKRMAALLILASSLAVPGWAVPSPSSSIVRPVMVSMPMEGFAGLPILHNGRVKPMETFANDVALRVAGTDTPAKTDATVWLANLVFRPASMGNMPMIMVGDPNTVALLGVPERFPRRYSLQELIPALQKQSAMVMRLVAQDEAQQNGASKTKIKGSEAELLAVYRRVQEVVTLGRSFSLTMPLFVVRDAGLAEKLGVRAGAPFDYMTLMVLRPKYLPLLEAVARRNALRQPMTVADKDLLALAFQARLMADDRASTLFRVLPPVWESAKGEWVSPWQSYASGLGGPVTLARLNLWKTALDAWQAQRPIAFAAAVKGLSVPPADIVTGGNPDAGWPAAWKIKLERLLNRLQPFTMAMVLALAGGLAAGAATLGRARALWLAGGSAALMLSGIALMGGMAARVAILGRPPVATLYESVLFVSVVTLWSGMGVAFWRRDGGLLALVGVLVAGLLGVAHWQAGQGDTLGMVLAVLNTRFWLTVHVLTITGGYGACLLLAGAAHALLVRQAWVAVRRGRNALTKKHEQGILILTVIALFLTAAGTVLGGVWADQSWGRFWGWDPKENGALLIVLWLTMLLHLRLAGWLKLEGFLLGCGGTTIVLGMSWFGVNLLNVGLHSYGFTTGLAEGLGLFVAGQIVVLALLAHGVQYMGVKRAR